jgi:restriction endonuclease S subunit
MTAFRLSENIDKNKVFLVNKSQIEKRLDPFYYVPELMELEEKVWQKNPQKLIHYAKAVSSGATPKTTESEKYYTDKENGIPFLRVQNLTSAGRLKLDNVKFINEETHNGMLARSKVKEGDLLIKITGVGRMAVSSVAPEGFEGNVNQHMVVMKTDSPETSKILAAFLNSDIGEKLASRRATGGTRPALDYPALLSVPIIYDERILKITEAAVRKKEAKEQQAKDLLASIDDYLLGELGIITLPEKIGELEKRIFTVNYSDATGKRWDSYYHQAFFTDTLTAVQAGKFNCGKLSETIEGYLVKGRLPKAEEKEGRCHVVQINSINNDGTINTDELLTAKNIFTKDQQLLENDILVVITGATIGKIAFWNLKGEYFLGGDIVKFQTAVNIDPYYVFNYLLSPPARIQIKRNITGATNGHLAPIDVKNIVIPLPPPKKQTEIANHIRQIREQARQLKQEAVKELEKASQEVEGLILSPNKETIKTANHE